MLQHNQKQNHNPQNILQALHVPYLYLALSVMTLYCFYNKTHTKKFRRSLEMIVSVRIRQGKAGRIVLVKWKREGTVPPPFQRSLWAG